MLGGIFARFCQLHCLVHLELGDGAQSTSWVSLCLVDYFSVARQRTRNAWMENHQHHDHGAGPNKQTGSKTYGPARQRFFSLLKLLLWQQYENIGRLFLAVVSLDREEQYYEPRWLLCNCDTAQREKECTGVQLQQ